MLGFHFGRYIAVCFGHRRILLFGLLVQPHQISTVADQARGLFAVSAVTFATPGAQRIVSGGYCFVPANVSYVPLPFPGSLSRYHRSALPVFMIVTGSGVLNRLCRVHGMGSHCARNPQTNGGSERQMPYGFYFIPSCRKLVGARS